ncbi:MAG TPA: hypothetical protein DEP25_02905, partial [Candidatus Taylorbacteria bacterium]|nr:hypothetical protein [Candidatus Taylorbacteria bacterium]
MYLFSTFGMTTGRCSFSSKKSCGSPAGFSGVGALPASLGLDFIAGGIGEGGLDGGNWAASPLPKGVPYSDTAGVV